MRPCLRGPACANVTRTLLMPTVEFRQVTPIRRTTILASLSLGMAVVAVATGYVGFEATIGGTSSHNRAITSCAATPSLDRISNRAAGVSVRDTWTWWLPGHSHVCVYEMKDGTRVVRPVPAGS